MTTSTAAAARRLLDATAAGRPTTPVRDLIGRDDVTAAYAVQQQVNAARVAAGSRVVGRKIGLTSKAVQRQLGVDRPDFGVLFDDMVFADGDVIPTGRLLQPKVEAEIAFLLGADLDGATPVRAAIEAVIPAIEVVDSRIAGWDISFGDTVADNASCGVFVLGTERLALGQIDPVAVRMTMAVDGVEVSTGTGAACLGDPLIALEWLATTVRELGNPLRAGEIVLSGALGPMAPVTPGAWVQARISGLGSVDVTFEKEQS